MTVKKLIAVLGVLALVAVLGSVVVVPAFAQSGTPPAQGTPTTPNQTTPRAPKGFFGRGFGFFGFGGGSTTVYDAVAKALGLTPTQLFDELHSGKTISQIAQEKGVDITTVQNAARAAQVQAEKDAINQAVQNGRISKAQGDWLLQGLDQGWIGGGRGFFGFGHGPRGLGGNRMPKASPTAPATGTTS